MLISFKVGTFHRFPKNIRTNNIQIYFNTMYCKGLIPVLILLILQTQGRDCYYTYDQLSVQWSQCYKQSGPDRINIMIDSTAEGINPQSVRSVLNAKAAGLQVEGVHTACRSRRSPEEEVKLIKKYGLDVLDKFWLYPGSFSPACQWDQYSAESNCQYFQKLIQLFKAQFRVPVDVATYYQTWVISFGSIGACPEVSLDTKLWFVPLLIDKKPDFQEYIQIGGWQKPYMKLYDLKNICDIEILVNYYE